MANVTSGVGRPGLGTSVPLPRWLVLLQGIIALALGILLLVYPVGVLLVLTMLLGIYWMINGVFVLLSLYSDRSDQGWKALVGGLGILAGILVLAYPLYSTALLPLFLAIIVGVAGLVIGAVHLVRGFSVVWQVVTDITLTKLFHIFYSHTFIITGAYSPPCLAVAVPVR